MSEFNLLDYDLLVVGSGFFGLTIAERAAKTGFRTLVVERRSHLGGNAWSEFEARSGIEVHKYGSHIFHTSSERIMNYVRNFTDLNGYEHRVWTLSDGQVFSLPINLHSISQIYGRYIAPQEAIAMFDGFRASIGKPKNLEEKAIQLVGPVLYEAFFRGYTAKQWETDPRDLPPDVITRLPVRTNFDSRYFDDKYQGLPTGGYQAWLLSMAEHPLIEVLLDTDYSQMRHEAERSRILTVYTGPVDEFFEYSAGPLAWRTIDLQFASEDVADFQGTAVINYADESTRATRTHEFKHLHPERDYIDRTVVAHEFSRFALAHDEPFYPVRTPSDREKLSEYRRLMDRTQNVLFGGRLATYQYLDMHMAIASALSLWENEVYDRLRESRSR